LAGVFALAGVAGYLLTGNLHVRDLVAPDTWEKSRENRELLLHLRKYYSLDRDNLKNLFNEGKIGQFLNARDPYSDYLDREEFETFEKETNQKYEGIGVQITQLDDGITITRVFPESPAQEAGLLPGDRILEVDGVDVTDFSINRIVQKITGPPETVVAIEVFRELTDETLTLRPVRMPIEYPSIAKSEMIAGRFGYIKIDTFGARTGREFEDALDELEASGLEGLVLDLRNNPGGMLRAAVDVAGLFFQQDEMVVEIRNLQEEDTEVFNARTPARDRVYPIVVLLNRGSASASEIVAGALRTTGRARILGERSYGKGSIQSIFALSNGDGLKMTTARYYFPDGSLVEDGKGLEPDVRVSLSYEESYKLRLQEYHEEILDAEAYHERFGFYPIQDRQISEAIRLLEDDEA